MKKLLSKKVSVIIGSAVLATGLLAIPVLAESNDEQSFFGKMQSFMASEQHQKFMNSSIMQELHNSDGMQEAMKTGDITKMQEVMNSNPEVRTLLGEETLNEMNQFMQENAPVMGQMMQGQNFEVMNQMHNSPVMQDAMKSGDFGKMVEAMNTPQMKELMGEEHVNQMTEFMKSGNMSSMHGQGGMMGRAQ